ncbi:MAG: C25 family cysteine peptidase [Candidatus Bathyarchaeota archaeon]|nr:C25 family cysteine peptidase [Candidatus Bathyarchaeota archaeon]
MLLLFSVIAASSFFLIPLKTFGAEPQIWVPFVSRAEPSDTLQILPKSADTLGLCVDSSFYGMYNIETTVNETLYNRLHMPGAGYAMSIGKPAVPMVTRFLEIPDYVDVSVDVLYLETRTLEGFNVIPTQEYSVDYANATDPEFVIDQVTYATDAFYPSEVAGVQGAQGGAPIVMRGHRLVPLNLYPVQFNPVTQQLKVHSKIEVRLNYDEPGQVGPIDSRLDSLAFEMLLEGFVLNYKNRGIAYLTKGEDAAEYLIITHDDFYHQAMDLADWKRQKGLRTKVVNTTQINSAGVTANDVENYIQNAYDSWGVAPTYVLLLGDSEFIPTHYNTPHPDDMHGNHNIATDLYYGTVDGTDYFPDIYVGRISVDTAQEANIIINKILDYEKNPPTIADFYSHVSSCAFFQDRGHNECGVWYNQDDYEDRAYVLTSEEIRDYLITQGYTVDRIYTADAGANPRNYSRCKYDNGDPLPPDLLVANGFTWGGTTADITNSINAGRFLVYHRDHGESRNFWDHDNGAWGMVDGWNEPTYLVGHIAGLTNGVLLPVVLSIECQAGWFDGETDQNDDAMLTRNVESFCEEFVRHQNGGAIATIGSTRNSYSGYNEELLKGFVDALWSDFDTSTASGGLHSLGQMLVYGKVYMASEYGYNDLGTQVTFELFHLFGDPELEIWTEQPKEFDVSHPPQIGSNGVQEFVVNVTDDDTGLPAPHVKICLQKGNQILGVTYTDPDGRAYFNVYPSTGGLMNITATKHNYEPYIGSITVTEVGASLSVNPDTGPSGITLNLQGSNFDGDESVDIYFGGSSPEKTVNAVGGSFTETLTVPPGAIGPVNVIAVGASGRRGVDLFRRLPDQPLPDPYTYCQWDTSTYHLNSEGGNPRWNSPTIQLYEAASGNPVASNDLRVGTTYTVEAIVHNDKTVPATDTLVTFEWASWGGGQTDWEYMGEDTITVLANGGQEVAEVNWTPSVTGHTCIRASIYHPWDENTDNNLGQENTHVHPVASPGEITFTFVNPTRETALIYLEAKQVGTDTLWPVRIEREYPQIQIPGENKQAVLVVDTPPDTAEGEKRIFTLSGYIDGELIGGIEVEVVVERSEQIDLCPIFLILIIIFIFIILMLIRRRSWKEKIVGLICIAIVIIIYILLCVLRI